MKMKLLATCIASAWLVTGCSGGSGSGSDSVSAASDSVSEATAQTASVNISAAFPQGAQAAAIDQNAQAILLKFYPSEAGSIEEAFEVAELSAQCIEERGQDWECLPYDGPSVGEPALLTAGSPSVSLNLVPGKYRVEAMQFDTATPDYDTVPLSSTSSFATLTAGEHALELNLVHATWSTSADITLQLLNNVIQDDTGADIDLNPEVAGTQTLANLMEMSDQPIIGMHMVGMPTFKAEVDGLFSGSTSEATAAYDGFPIDTYDMDPEEIIGQVIGYWLHDSIHIPVIRQSDGSTGETVVWWWEDPTMDMYCNISSIETENGHICLERGSRPAVLLQGYDGTNGNTNLFDLGEVWANYEEYSYDTDTEIDIEGGIATVPFGLEDPDITVADGNVTLNWGDGASYAHVYTDSYETLSGVEEATFLDLDSDSGSTTYPDDANRLDQVDAPSITGGTTITGTFIEFLIQFNEQEVGVEVPTVPSDITPDQATNGDEFGGTDPVDAIMASQAAVAAGLVAAPAATANGENCSVITENFTGAYTQFIWDETSESWVGGTWNYSYYLFDSDGDGINDTIEGEDMNGDGTIDRFEVGVYENWTCMWDEVTQMDICEDLDGAANDEDDRIETVPTGWEETGDGEYCLHPFTMTAGQLEFSFSDLMSSTDVTVQN